MANRPASRRAAAHNDNHAAPPQADAHDDHGEHDDHAAAGEGGGSRVLKVLGAAVGAVVMVFLVILAYHLVWGAGMPGLSGKSLFASNSCPSVRSELLTLDHDGIKLKNTNNCAVAWGTVEGGGSFDLQTSDGQWWSTMDYPGGPTRKELLVVAIRGHDGYAQGYYELCDHGYVADSNWRCKPRRPQNN